MHREADEKRKDRAPETDAGELKGEESGLPGDGEGAQRVDSKGGGKCDRKGAHRGGIPDNYEVARKQPRRAPSGRRRREMQEEGEARRDGAEEADQERKDERRRKPRREDSDPLDN